MPNKYAYAESFTVVELEKRRQRYIAWPRRALRRSKYVSEFATANMATDLKRMKRCRYAAAFDLKASFFQVALPTGINFLVADQSGNIYRLDRMPMGMDASPEVMQMICAALLGSPTSVETDVHIDNIIIAGQNKRDIQKAIDDMIQNASFIGATFNMEEANIIATKVLYCGAHFDFARRVTTLKPEFVTKIPHAVDEALTWVGLQALMGRLFFAAQVITAYCPTV